MALLHDIPERTNANPYVGQGSWNEQVKANMEDLDSRLETAEATLGEAIEGTLYDAGSSSGPDPASVSVGKAGWYMCWAYLTGDWQTGAAGGDYADARLYIDGDEVARADIWGPEDVQVVYHLSGGKLVECPLGSETIEAEGSLIEGTGIVHGWSVQLFARWDKPSA